MIDLNKIPQISGDVVYETHPDGTIVVYNMKTDDFLQFNQIGSTIWKLCGAERTVQEIISELLNRFKVQENICKQHTVSFFERLTDNGLIIWVVKEISDK